MIRGPKEKKERALGTRLGLKPERSNSPKAATVRKPYRPGAHGQNRPRSGSDFSAQLKEKQKFKLSYGLKEKQLRAVFDKSIKAGSITRDKVFELLEQRLDNVVYRLGFLPSRLMARQAIRHGHIRVGGRRVTFPSFQVKIGSRISITPSSRDLGLFRDLSNRLKKYNPPAWLKLDLETFTGEVLALPTNVDTILDPKTVVEFYSR